MKIEKKIIWLAIFLIGMSYGYAYECQPEEVPGEGCTVTSPGNMTCATYSIYAENGTEVFLWATMSELTPNTGVYNFTFNQSQDGGYTIHLCDGSTSTIKVGSTIRQEVDAIEENQAVLQQLILDTQTNISSVNASMADNVWQHNISDMNNQTAGGQLNNIWERIRSSQVGSLIAELLSELSGGYFG